LSFCVSVVAVDPTDDPIIDGTLLFDRPPLTGEERVLWSRSPRTSKPFPISADGRRRHLGPLLIEEALQSTGHACSIAGLHTYYPGDWQGRGYFLYADTGGRYASAAPIRQAETYYDSGRLVAAGWEENDDDDNSWGYLAIRAPYRQPAETFLRAALAASRDRRILVVCELNGNVSDYLSDGILTGAEEVHPNPRARRLGPVRLTEFWREHDNQRIIIPGRCIGNGGHAAHRAMSASSAFVRLPHFFGGRHAAGGTR